MFQQILNWWRLLLSHCFALCDGGGGGETRGADARNLYCFYSAPSPFSFTKFLTELMITPLKREAFLFLTPLSTMRGSLELKKTIYVALCIADAPLLGVTWQLLHLRNHVFGQRLGVLN